VAASTGGTERMRINSSGSVGIGVTPSAWASGNKFIDVNASASYGAFGSSDSMMLANAYWNGSNWIRKNANNAWRMVMESTSGGPSWTFQYAGNSTAGSTISWSEAMRIDPNGNLLVGTTTLGSSERLNVTKSTTDWVQRIYNSNASPKGLAVIYDSAAPNGTSNTFLYCQDNAAIRAEIRSNGGLANYSANNVNLSDVRTKTDVQNAGNYLAKICAIPVRTFKYKDQTDDLLNLGCIAQEVEAVAPELVDVSGFGETPEDGVPLKAIYQTDLQYALMKALQELKAELDATKAEVALLKGAA
jgi:hypothetical protein